MPELPEVETIKNALNKFIKGKTILDIKVLYPPIVNNLDNFSKLLTNQTIKEVKREAKFLKFILDDYVLISHLRMEGKYFINDELTSKHTHVIFNLSDNIDLAYHDTRKFGRFEIVDIKDEANYLSEVKGLAKDPKDISFDIFYEKILNSRRPIKNILLDQSVIGGIGNIYANEILFKSKINPNKKGILITKDEAKLILKESINTLDLAIKMGGTTIKSYKSLGESGTFQRELLVQGREGLPCIECSTIIEKNFISGRGTYFCPKCQKSHIIAITGGIASGKTTTTEYLKKLGFDVIDSDLIVKDLYKDPLIITLINKEFNLLEKDYIDTKKLSNIIFNKKEERLKLESIIHPLVFEKLEDKLSNTFFHIIFLDIPLLFETGYKKYDKSLLISTTRENQIKRLMKRNNINKDEANLIIDSQMSLKEKEKLADYIIYNNKDINDLYQEIDIFLKTLK